jgi:hypothetical protein
MLGNKASSVIVLSATLVKAAKAPPKLLAVIEVTQLRVVMVE